MSGLALSAEFADFPEAADFPEREPVAGGYKDEADWFTKKATFLVRTKLRARVEYESGRVATLHAAEGLTVERDGAVSLRLLERNRGLKVRLEGIDDAVPEGLTPEQAYGWRGGALLDQAARNRPVPLAEISRHKLLALVYHRPLWVEFVGETPATPYRASYRAILYSPEGECLNHRQIGLGFARAARGTKRCPSLLQSLEDRAARKKAGLWREATWRAMEPKGFAFTRARPAPPATGRRPRPPAP